MKAAVKLMMILTGPFLWTAQGVFAAEQSTYDIALAGRTCSTKHKIVSCQYQVGNSLIFRIDAIGTPITTLTFLKSSIDDDFYAGYEIESGCVIIRRGLTGETSDSFLGPGSMTDYAFVSLKSGKLYRTSSVCKTGF